MVRNFPVCSTRSVALICAFVAVVFLSPNTIAQTFRGTILGTVTDATGAAVAGANVTVHNVDTGVDRVTQTGVDGAYLVPELPVGTYRIAIEKSGFQKSVTEGVKVDVAAQRRVDAVLQPGQMAQQVVVSADVLPQVDTTLDTLGGVLTQESVKNLPINGRDYTKLIYLNPGVAGSPDQISDSPGSYGEFSMNGARGRSNNYLLDGTDMNDGYRNDPAINQGGVFGVPSAILPIDAISELNVLSNYQPEFGRNGGAVVNIVTKSGTNALHGDAFEYFRNDALDARNYFNFTGETPKAPFRNNQFGGSLGGPITKDKTFFFVDYEGQREGVGVVTLACVPDPAQIAADGGATNPVIASLLARNPWPAPNIPGVATTDTGCPAGPNASVTAPSYNNLTSFIGKVDHNFDQNNVLTGRYFFGDSTQAFPLALTASGGQLPGFDTVTPTRVQLVSISYVHVLSPTQTNEVRYGWNRFAEGFFPQDQAFHPSSIGLCAASSTAQCAGGGEFDSGLPIIQVGGFSQLGASSSSPRHRFDTNNQFIDDFSWKSGRHDMKFGFEFRRTSIQQYFGKYSRGRLTFNDLSDLLSGSVDAGFQYGGNSLRHTYQNNVGFYAQDGFHLTPRFVLNYGLRWDYYGVVGEKNNLLSNITAFDVPNQTFTLTQVGQPGLSQLYRPDHKDFSPRVSAAWDVFGSGRTVLRAGYGMFFDAFSQDMLLGHLPYPPFFDAGPAYNNIGPFPILPAGITGSIVSNQPVYGTPSCSAVECDIFAFDRNLRTPYMENYNLNIEQQISGKVFLQVGYVGSQGHRLLRFVDLNQPSQAAITASDMATAAADSACYSGTTLIGGLGCITSGYSVPRPYQNNPYGAFYVLQEQSSAKSNYNSLQASLRVNGWRGITSVLNYVWSRSMDNASDGEDFEPNAAQPNNSTNPQLEYGPSNFDVPQRLTWIFGYQLPHMGGAWSRLRNGWGLDSAVNLQSGQPFQLNYNFESDFSGSGEGFDRPDIVGPVVYNTRNPANFLQLSSFAIPCTLSTYAQVNGIVGSEQDCQPGTRHFGTLGRDALRGPNFKQWDLALYKDTRITERLAVQLRADFFNILNHPNFANPFLPAYISDPAINGLTAQGTREVGTGAFPLTATGDVGIGNPFLGGGGPRGIQLAAKFSF